MFVLTERGFRRLVRGEPISVEGETEIKISDSIGWVKMFRAILDAIAPPLPPDPVEAREFLPRSGRRR